MAQVIRWLTAICLFALVACTTAQADLTPEQVLSLPNDVKGFVGEAFVRDLYKKGGRVELLNKFSPTKSGPDLLYVLPDGRLEMHEVGASKTWRGKAKLRTTVAGTKMDQLSDAWIHNWTDSPVDREAALRVEQAMKEGRLVRIYDEVNLATGEMRSSTALPDGMNSVRLEEKMGPIKIKRFLADCEEHAKKLALLNADPKNARAKLFSKPAIQELERKPKVFADYEDAFRARRKRAIVRPGLLLPNGRLLVAMKAGAADGVLVFALDAGVAGYQYLNGDILRPEFERKVGDAAVKGVAVGSATAVAVFLVGGTGPAGWAVLGIGIGAYMVTDAALTKWHQEQDRRFVSADDLRKLGVEVDSILNVNADSLLKAGERSDGLLGVERKLDSPLKYGR
jgi:hypothetical protein